MNEVEEYSFGYIRVSGKSYSRDLIIYPDRVKEDWWRIEGHRLDLKDIEEVIQYKPKTLIVGTGAYGYMKVPKELIDELERRGIEVRVAKTSEACKIFNELVKRGVKAVAALHLTC